MHGKIFAGRGDMTRREWSHRLCAAVLLSIVALTTHAAEKVLYDQPSLFGSIIVSEDDNGLRILRFEKGGARQSLVKPGDPEYLGLPYAQVAFVGLALCDEPRRIAVIGLGGGTLPMFLRKQYPQASIDAVDIDPGVVQVAARFFGFQEDEYMRAHVGDGREFIERVRQPYDVIFLDAYGSDKLPAHLTTSEYLRAVRSAVRADGVVVGNVWDRYANPLYDAMIRTYQEVFDELYILDVRGAGNKILLALPRKQALSRDQLAQLARKVSVAKGFRFDLGDQVEYGFLHARQKNPGERVLRDADAAPSAGGAR
jgi:spermidine synthase